MQIALDVVHTQFAQQRFHAFRFDPLGYGFHVGGPGELHHALDADPINRIGQQVANEVPVNFQHIGGERLEVSKR